MLALTTALFLLLAPVLGHGPGPARAPDAPAALAASSRLTEVHFTSQALGGRERYRVYLPPGYDAGTRSYPVLVLLHGLGGEGDDWFDPTRGDLARYLDEAIGKGVIGPVVALAPDGRDGYWTDHVSHAPGTGFGTFIGEVMDDAAARFRLRADSAAIIGVSMGGHGSMSFGLMHPDRFRAIVSMAGALFAEPPTHRPIYKRVWGDPADRDYFAKTTPVALLRAWPAGQRLPALWLHCGRDDKERFLDWNVAADRLLTDRHIAHAFTLSDGGHAWGTWRPMATQWLAWLGPLLR